MMYFFRRIRRKLPKYADIQKIKYIHVFGDILRKPQLWSFTRRTCAKGVAIGIFCAFLPMPFEMLIAIFLAIVLRGNIPLSATVVWISNPVTWVPLYTPCYMLGNYLLQIEPIPIQQISWQQMGWHAGALWLGCLIVGSVLSALTYSLIQGLWITEIRKRRKSKH